MLKLQEGTIVQKLHYNDLEDLKFTKTLNIPKKYPQELKSYLDSIMVLDQKYRGEFSPETWGKQVKIDQQNMGL